MTKEEKPNYITKRWWARKLYKLLEIQGQHGNWNYDPYMFGFYNGIECAIACFEERSAKYPDQPKKWLNPKYNRKSRISMKKTCGPIGCPNPKPPKK